MSANTFHRRLEIYENLLPKSAQPTPSLGKSYHEIVGLLGEEFFSASSDTLAKRKAVESDLKELMLVRPQIERVNRGKDFVFYIREKRKSIFNKSAESALLKLMVNEHMYGLIPTNIWQTLQSEVSQSRHELTGNQAIFNWNKKIYSASFGFEPKIKAKLFDKHVFSSLLTVLFEESRCQIEYQTVNKPPETITNLHPIGLYRRGSSFYMVAYKDGTNPQEEMPRQFAVHRIKQLWALKDQIHPSFKTVQPEELEQQGFYLDVFEQQGDSHKPIEMKLTTENPYILHLLSEWEFSDNDQVLNGTEQGVRFKAPLTRQLQYWVRSFGSSLQLHTKLTGQWHPR